MTALLPRHAELIAASAITDDVASERGYYSETVKARLADLGFSQAQRLPGLVIPLHGFDQRVVGHQLRPDKPREKGGRTIKYETPRGFRMRLDVHPRARARIGDPAVPLVITCRRSGHGNEPETAVHVRVRTLVSRAATSDYRAFVPV